MPPRSKKAASTSTIAPDPPIVYFLRVRKDAQTVHEPTHSVPTAMENGTYSEILKEESKHQQFDETVIHDIVSKIHTQVEYSAGVVCFWCCHAFAWKSIVIPTHYDMYIHRYNAEGHFCSPECALSYVYADASITDAQKWLRHSLLQAVYQPLLKGKELFRAPDRRVLRMFGGTLSIDQFRMYIRERGTPLQLAMPPIQLYMPSINTQVTARDVKSYVSLSDDTVHKASQQLRLKRSKPVHSSTSTLDKCMGLHANGSNS